VALQEIAATKDPYGTLYGEVGGKNGVVRGRSKNYASYDFDCYYFREANFGGDW